MVSPILLFGVDAPAVIPMTLEDPSHPSVTDLRFGADRLVPDCAGGRHPPLRHPRCGRRATPCCRTSAARWQVLLELYPPTTTIRSSGSCSNASTASCRSWVAEQMVSKERKCWSMDSARTAGPCSSAPPQRWPAIRRRAWWSGWPVLPGSGPARNRSRVTPPCRTGLPAERRSPPRSMKSQIIRASVMSSTTR